MKRAVPVEIRNFESLKDLSIFVDDGISWYERFLKEYNERLGDLLREQGSSSEELSKRLREKGLTRQSKKKKKSEASSEDWFSFRGLMFSAEKQNKAEIFFEAVDKTKKSLESLKETKTLIGELQNIGLGPDLVYSVYFADGVPEKIFVEPAGNVAPKFKFQMFLSTSPESLAAMEENAEEKAASDQEEAMENDELEQGEESEEENRAAEAGTTEDREES